MSEDELQKIIDDCREKLPLPSDIPDYVRDYYMMYERTEFKDCIGRLDMPPPYYEVRFTKQYVGYICIGWQFAGIS